VVPSKRALVSSYSPSMVTFPLSFRVSEILPLLFSSAIFSLYPTPFELIRTYTGHYAHMIMHVHGHQLSFNSVSVIFLPCTFCPVNFQSCIFVSCTFSVAPLRSLHVYELWSRNGEKIGPAHRAAIALGIACIRIEF